MFPKSSSHTIRRWLCHRSWIWYLLARRFWGASCTSKSAPRPFLSPMPSSHVPLYRNRFLLGTLLGTYLVLHAFVNLEAISSTKCFWIRGIVAPWTQGEIERPSLLLWFFYFLDSKISRSNLANCSRIAIFRKTLFWPHEILRPSKTVACQSFCSFLQIAVWPLPLEDRRLVAVQYRLQPSNALQPFSTFISTCANDNNWC